MVLEELIPVQTAERKPIYVLPIAFVYTSLALFFALWMFPSHAALVAVVLVTLLTMPLFWRVVGFEKKKQESTSSYLKNIIFALKDYTKDRDKLLMFFIWLFVGLSIATAFWFVFLPSDMLKDLFYIQLNTIKEINLALSGGAISQDFFLAILTNNVKVLALTILFSFVFGAGAMFILAWNASVIGVAVGDTVRTSLAVTKTTGVVTAVNYTGAISTGLFRYFLHGVPEILAYFLGALAGAMLSIAVIKHEVGSEHFKKTIQDISGLILLALGLILLA
ncbi:MAG: stage II sporulation protein M, partial [Candidatus Nanoarchaeia archaeon]